MASRFLRISGMLTLGTITLASAVLARAPGTTQRSTDAPASQPASGSDAGPTNDSPRLGALGPIEKRFLSNDDIQIIRQNELRPNDTAKVQIPIEVRRNFAAKSGMSFAEFNNKSSIEQAMAILAGGDPEMRKAVKVVSDPQSMIEFKQLLPPILAGCASMNCHGGKEGGKLILFNPADSDAAKYTDFYVLAKYAQAMNASGGKPTGGIFGGPTDRKLIDRGHGMQSLLVQFGIPPLKAEVQHPKAMNYSPVFRDATDPRAKKLADWMNVTLNQIEPDYSQIKYKIISYSTTQPATAPAAK